ncbi:MAG TPA: metallophosphoesterase family protein [Ktedonobacteraceae bacterium]|nr:metallophosphoesterase family protein [Ktedonobacteraceae bacterium]
MKVAALYDIHGNLPALDAVLQEVEQEHPDLILVGGDIVPGPMPRATLERLLALGDKIHYIRGNCEREVVAAFDGLPLDPGMSKEVSQRMRWTAKQLEPSQRDFLASLPEHLALTIEGLGEVLFCHGSPRSDEEILTVATPEPRLREALAGVKQRIIVCGHTHMQYERHLDEKTVVNAGSVGMPYAEPGAYWLELGPEIVLRRTPYDLEQAAAAVRASGYPEAEDFAANNILRPAKAAEVTEFFERSATQRS